jgi:hypothetical protein
MVFDAQARPFRGCLGPDAAEQPPGPWNPPDRRNGRVLISSMCTLQSGAPLERDTSLAEPLSFLSTICQPDMSLLPRDMSTRLLPASWAGHGLAIVGMLLVGAGAGWAIAQGNLLLALLPIFMMGGLLLLTGLSLAGWCIVLLLVTVAGRGLASVLHLPSMVVFVHYPATVAFAFAAAQRGRRQGGVPATKWAAGVLLLTVLSSIVNFTNPLRGLMFLLIAGEPLLVVWAIQRWGPDEATERRVSLAAMWLLALQIPLGLWQGARGGFNDSVAGTLVGQSTAAHLLGGLFALGMFVWLASVLDGRYPRWTAAFIAVIALGMMAAAGAMQVIFSSAFALPFVVFLSRGTRLPKILSKRLRAQRRRTPKLLLALVALLFTASVPFWVNRLVPGLLQRAVETASAAPRDELTFASERARTRPLQFFLGSGPGTTASRAALLLSPAYSKEGSIFRQLPLKPTKTAEDIAELSQKSNTSYGGSAENPESEMLGIVGDLGIVGFIALTVLFFRVFQASRRTGSWLAPALGAALIMTWILCFIDNWLEYPEFGVPFAILIGFATSTYRSSPKKYVRVRGLGMRPLASSDRA